MWLRKTAGSRQPGQIEHRVRGYRDVETALGALRAQTCRMDAVLIRARLVNREEDINRELREQAYGG